MTIARKFADDTVVIDDVEYTVTAKSETHVALFRPGRSVYRPSVGSEYEPARIFFAEIGEDREGFMDIDILLDSPIRRR